MRGLLREGARCLMPRDASSVVSVREASACGGAQLGWDGQGGTGLSQRLGAIIPGMRDRAEKGSGCCGDCGPRMEQLGRTGSTPGTGGCRGMEIGSLERGCEGQRKA